MNKDEILSLGYSNEFINKTKGVYLATNYSDELLYQKINAVYYCLKGIGFSHNDIINITSSYPGIFIYDSETIREKISDYVELGFTRNEIKKMIRSCPKIISIGLKNVNGKINFLIELKFSRDEIMKMIKIAPSLLIYSIKIMKQKINDLQELGYSYDQVLKMIRNSSVIFGYSMDSIKQKINHLIELGYTYDEVITMTVKFSALLGYDTGNIDKKIDDLLLLGYTKEQIKYMTIVLPSIFGLSIDNIREKKEFYDSIGIGDILIKRPSMLIQGIELSYARYMFYKSNGIEINENNHLLLFCLQDRFKKKYGKSNKELMEEFNYNKYLEEKKCEFVIRKKISC